MRAASTQLGLSPATTMHIAESLYTQVRGVVDDYYYELRCRKFDRNAKSMVYRVGNVALPLAGLHLVPTHGDVDLSDQL